MRRNVQQAHSDGLVGGVKKHALMIAAALIAAWPAVSQAVPPADWWYLQVCTETWTNTVTGETVVHTYQNNGTTISGHHPFENDPVWTWGDWKQELIVCINPPLGEPGIAGPVTGTDLVVSTGPTGSPGDPGPAVTAVDLISDGNLFFSANNAGQLTDLTDPNFGLASTTTAAGSLLLNPSVPQQFAIIELDYSGMSRFVEYTVSFDGSTLSDQFGLPYTNFGTVDYTLTIPGPTSMAVFLSGVGALAVRRRRANS